MTDQKKSRVVIYVPKIAGLRVVGDNLQVLYANRGHDAYKISGHEFCFVETADDLIHASTHFLEVDNFVRVWEDGDPVGLKPAKDVEPDDPYKVETHEDL